mmetsp:Transcript_5315/g.18511  ORF Transcript_5315/g.18511 Transcript_5315/m.18511 type:complete len:202 (+) Transcript_5315:1582-2187(+)
MVVGTVGSLRLLASRSASALARSASLPGSTLSAKAALASVYSWAQYTSVPGPYPASCCSEAHIWPGVPSNRRPHPRANIVSPTKSAPSGPAPWKWYDTWPLVCPGVSTTVHAASPTSTTSPPLTRTSTPGIRPSSAAAPTTVAPCRSLSSTLAPTWSRWWCVLSMCVRRHPRAARARSTGAASGVSTTAVHPLEGSCTRKT